MYIHVITVHIHAEHTWDHKRRLKSPTLHRKTIDTTVAASMHGADINYINHDLIPGEWSGWD
jgi:hypothetical protein